MKNPFDEEDLRYQQIEYRIHCAIVEQFDSAFPTAMLWHTPNRPGDAADGFFKKKMGSRKGISDLGLSWKSEGTPRFGGGGFEWDTLKCGWYEVKAPGKYPTPEQNKWLSAFAHLGWFTGWGTSVAQAFNTFESWGIPRRHHAVKEPDTRSDMQKKASAFDWFKPELIKKMDFE